MNWIYVPAYLPCSLLNYVLHMHHVCGGQSMTLLLRTYVTDCRQTNFKERKRRTELCVCVCAASG